MIKIIFVKYMKKFFMYFLFILLYHINIVELKTIVFPVCFSSQLYINYLNFNVNKKQEIDLNGIFKYIFENKIISNIIIGSPEQEMMVLFSNEEKYFYLSKNTDVISEDFLCQTTKKGKYSTLLSSTFILKNEIQYDAKRYNIVHLGSDEILFDNKKRKTFKFLIENDKISEPIYYGIIGIGLDSNKDLLNYPNFINQLSYYDLIKNYYWYIDYDTNTLIIGEEIYKNNNNYKYQEILTKPFYNINKKEFLIMNWNLIFDEISMEEKYNYTKFVLHDKSFDVYGTYGNLNIDFGFIVGSPKYRIFLNEKYFNGLINDGKCFNHIYKPEDAYKKNYYGYSCYKTYEKELKEKFQPLIFISKELNYKFELDYDDLFININNNKLLFFLISFEVVNDDTNFDTWILGEPFLRKYNFIFNPDKKTIIFKQNISNYYKKRNKVLYIIIVLFCFVFLYIFFSCIKKYKIKFSKKNLNKDNHLYLDTNNNKTIKKTLELKDSLLLINNNNNKLN